MVHIFPNYNLHFQEEKAKKKEETKQYAKGPQEAFYHFFPLKYVTLTEKFGTPNPRRDSNKKKGKK